MSFIQFESATEKEKIRQELRNAREELLSKAKRDAEVRAKAEVDKQLRGEDNWMLPSLSEKIETQSKHLQKSKKSKKVAKEKKNKREKKKSKQRKGDKKEKKKKRRKQRSSSEDSTDSGSDGSGSRGSGDEWVEKKVDLLTESGEAPKRDDWMTGSFLLPTYRKNVENKEPEKQQIDSYDPGKSSRELNPYWKDGGTGLPTFRKPKDDDDTTPPRTYRSEPRKASGNWRKRRESPREERVEVSRKPDSRRGTNPERSTSSSPEREVSRNREQKPARSEGTSSFLTDQQMNELGAKLIKAEIMGDDELAKELKAKLDKARNVRTEIKDKQLTEPAPKQQKDEREDILLTTTDSRGVTRPLPSRSLSAQDPYSKKGDKRKKVDTHEEGKRVKYFPDDDRYDIHQMFEREKYTTARESDEQFVKIAGKQKNTKDDLEDIFADNVRKEISEHEADEKEKRRAIKEHERMSRVLDTCDRCFDSPKMEKQLLVAMGTTVYMSLPWHEGLQTGHCILAPIQHVSCSTQLDEDSWAEMNDMRKALTRMFASRSMDVVFFEIARYLNRRPHMAIHCVPSKGFEMAPFYFKKAIQESEYMWSTNKQLISLSGKDVRRAIPKGLPYFWVHFGMESGFAHVIEDQERFPANFAQEVIGGMLELDARTWRRPRKEHNSVQKVKQFAEWWKPFDCTT